MAQTTQDASFGPVFVVTAYPKLPIGARDAYRYDMRLEPLLLPPLLHPEVSCGPLS